MKTNKTIAALLAALALTLSLTACGADGAASQNNTAASSQQSGQPADQTVSAVTVSASDLFSDSDYAQRTESDANAVIELSGGTGTLSDTTRGSSGDVVTVTAKGTYLVTGSSEGVSIVINDTSKSGNIYLLLDNVTMTNDSAPCITVDSADKVIIQCIGDSSLESQASAVIDADDDLTVTGSGSLNVTGAQHGVVCRNDLRVTGAQLTVSAGKIGLKAGDSVRIDGGVTAVNAGHDGIQAENDEGTSFFFMGSGALTVNADYDGISVTTALNEFTGYLMLSGGSVELTAGGGASMAADDTSRKGLRCDGSIVITDGVLNVSAADDAVNAGSYVQITGGETSLACSDDGLHADESVSVTGGTLKISKSYEGIESGAVTLSGGEIRVTASDDGINAAGTETAAGDVTITGGSVYVNSGGDGIDANGSILVSGGLVIVEGPSGAGNGALDRGDGVGCTATVTGGTVLAIGSADMAINFDSGTQCSALLALSGAEGTVITVDDGSGFSFTASQSFECVVYSSPEMTQGDTYTVTAGGQSAAADFTDGLYYTDVFKNGGAA